jgi:alpha-tubulin suppressor-like RCC1 family protein
VCGTACPAGTLGDGLNVCIPVATIAADTKFTCGLLSTGKVSCWGDTTDIDPVAAGVSSFVFTSISSNWDKVCGIRDNGQIVCWGSVPSTHAGPYIALAMGSNHTCAIKANQSLECWSYDGDTVTEAEPSGKYKGIAAMDHYSCAIISGGTSDGKLKCWGDSLNYSSIPTDVFKRVIGGANHACGIKTDGTIKCWGLLYYPQFPASTQFKTLGYGGSTHYCGILTDNSIFCWGLDGGVGGPNASIPAGSFKAVAVGTHHTCGVTTGGQVVCAGSEDTYGQGANQPGPFQGYW